MKSTYEQHQLTLLGRDGPVRLFLGERTQLWNLSARWRRCVGIIGYRPEIASSDAVNSF
jgi:hypothetical protein